MTQSTHSDQGLNLLGAVSLAVVDRMSAAAEEAAEHGAAAPAALVALHEFLDSGTVAELAAVVGITLSGTVRLLDRLESAKLVRRRPGEDRRSVALTLTPAGRRTARRILEARGRLLHDLLAGLTADEQDALGRLNAKILTDLTRGGEPPRRTCRLCDAVACGHPTGRCPVTNAARALRQETEADEGRGC